MSIHVYRGNERPRFAGAAEAHPITTEIIRRALNSAAQQMARATVRTAFSVPVYEGLDFAVVLYDRHLRLLAQAPTSPIFMGSMSFCIEAAIGAVGGESRLAPGDVLLYNRPYGTGAHAQDCAVIMPIFLPDGALIGYAANKAHWIDIGAASIYCSNTTDVFQEGLVIPGVRILAAGRWNEDLHRLILANSRAPSLINGDLNAQIASCHVGARELLRIVERFGLKTFRDCTERMIDHGESIVRRLLESIPDGRYEATCHMDDDGVDDAPIEFEIAVEIAGSDIIFDFTRVPDATRGPINCPLPTTVSGARVAMAMLAGAGSTHEIPNEGHFRPLSIRTRPGSMFHPLEPAPCFLYGWPMMSAMEGIYEAMSKASPKLAPAGSAADICGVLVYGRDADGELFAIASPMPVGQGAHAGGDGHTLMVSALAQSTLTGAEIQEAKSPVLFEKWEFTPDSAGAGRFRGGHGWEFHYRVLRDVSLISVIERTRVAGGFGQRGGHAGSRNRLCIDYPDGQTRELRKVTDLKVPAGARVRVWAGGGGGYGDPAERDPQAVRRDVRDGVLSAAAAQKIYTHALQGRQYINDGVQHATI